MDPEFIAAAQEKMRVEKEKFDLLMKKKQSLEQDAPAQYDSDEDESVAVTTNYDPTQSVAIPAFNPDESVVTTNELDPSILKTDQLVMPEDPVVEDLDDEVDDSFDLTSPITNSDFEKQPAQKELDFEKLKAKKP